MNDKQNEPNNIQNQIDSILKQLLSKNKFNNDKEKQIQLNQKITKYQIQFLLFKNENIEQNNY